MTPEKKDANKDLREQMRNRASERVQRTAQASVEFKRMCGHMSSSRLFSQHLFTLRKKIRRGAKSPVALLSSQYRGYL